MSKLNPKRYADRVAAELSGPDGKPIGLTPIHPPLPPAEVGIAVAELLVKATAELGLTVEGDASAVVKAIVARGDTMPPSIYSALCAAQLAPEDSEPGDD